MQPFLSVLQSRGTFINTDVEVARRMLKFAANKLWTFPPNYLRLRSIYSFHTNYLGLCSSLNELMPWFNNSRTKISSKLLRRDLSVLTRDRCGFYTPSSAMAREEGLCRPLVLSTFPLQNAIQRIAFRFSSTLKKRRAKMNKHKLRKRRKLERLKSK